MKKMPDKKSRELQVTNNPLLLSRVQLKVLCLSNIEEYAPPDIMEVASFAKPDFGDKCEMQEDCSSS
jgi:hypothetical protein